MEFLQSLILLEKRRSKKREFTNSGITSDDKSVMGNVFRYYDTEGVALEDIIMKFDEVGYIVDWVDFYEAAKRAGWKDATILKKIDYALIDTKGKEYAQQVLNQLQTHI